MEFLRTVAEWVVLGLLSLGLITAPAALPQDQAVGAALPQQDALVDTYLSAGINKTVTEMTLADGTTRDGETLIGYYCFTIDINTPTVEYVCGTASSTSVTGLMRGVKASDPTATSSSLAFVHRKLASVQVTDFPFNQLVQRRINGTDAFESALTFNAVNTYASALTFTPGSNQIPSVLYVDSLANQGAATSSETGGGIVELATQIEMASSTDLGANRPLVLQAKYATSSPYTTGLWAVITNNAGKIAQTFLDLTATFTWTGLHTFTNASSTQLSIFNTLWVGGSATSTIQGSTSGTSTLQGFLNVSGTNSTSTFSGKLSVLATTTLSGCVGCLGGYELLSQAIGNYNGGTPALVGPTTLTCSTGKRVVGGGVVLDSNTANEYQNYPSANNTWTVAANANNNGSTAAAGTMYAICVYP